MNVRNSLVNLSPYQAHIPCYTLVWINPILSPMIYVVLNLQYRQAFLKSLQESVSRSL